MKFNVNLYLQYSYSTAGGQRSVAERLPAEWNRRVRAGAGSGHPSRYRKTKSVVNFVIHITFATRVTFVHIFISPTRHALWMLKDFGLLLSTFHVHTTVLTFMSFRARARNSLHLPQLRGPQKSAKMLVNRRKGDVPQPVSPLPACACSPVLCPIWCTAAVSVCSWVFVQFNLVNLVL